MGPADTTALDVRRSVTITETAERVLLPWASGRIPRYHSSAADTVTVVAGYTPMCDIGGGAIVTRVPGALVALQGGCNHASNGSSFSIRRIAPGG